MSTQNLPSFIDNVQLSSTFYDIVADAEAYKSELRDGGLNEEQVMIAILAAFGIKEDPAAAQAIAYPKYWKPLPAHWRAIDTYRIGELFPTGDPSARIDHARKKLLVPGVRTGGKSLFHDISEAHSTLGAWIMDNK